MSDGEIVHCRDYWNPLAAAETMGGLGAMVERAGRNVVGGP
ncbi:hypothetical protein [Nonomuraea longispora]|nr:hypothetical protein [Nonomuraea longispora]